MVPVARGARHGRRLLREHDFGYSKNTIFWAEIMDAQKCYRLLMGKAAPTRDDRHCNIRQGQGRGSGPDFFDLAPVYRQFRVVRYLLVGKTTV
jgi:hypothetical protein